MGFQFLIQLHSNCGNVKINGIEILIKDIDNLETSSFLREYWPPENESGVRFEWFRRRMQENRKQKIMGMNSLINSSSVDFLSHFQNSNMGFQFLIQLHSNCDFNIWDQIKSLILVHLISTVFWCVFRSNCNGDKNNRKQLLTEYWKRGACGWWYVFIAFRPMGLVIYFNWYTLQTNLEDSTG